MELSAPLWQLTFMSALNIQGGKARSLDDATCEA